MGQVGPLVEGPRPPLGIIIFDDGTTVVVDSDLLLGREPDNDPAVVSGGARAVVIDDPVRTISRVHAGILLEGWTVKAVDRGSANGTFVAGPTDQDWVELVPHRPAVIKPGTRLRLGHRAFLLDSYPRGR
jgi:pSer/pThr/pTyr-binding forkhead associated (FHA) protein